MIVRGGGRVGAGDSGNGDGEWRGEERQGGGGRFGDFFLFFWGGRGEVRAGGGVGDVDWQV